MKKRNTIKKRRTILDTVHRSVKGLHRAGLVDTVTMRKFDELCVEPAEKLNSSDIRKIRLKEKVSQTVFAKYLNISPSTVQKWETGEKRPSGIALRFLHVIGKSGLSVIPTHVKGERF
jgi:putative transcriptional regulator